MLIRVSAWYHWKVFVITSLVCENICSKRNNIFNPRRGHIMILRTSNFNMHAMHAWLFTRTWMSMSSAMIIIRSGNVETQKLIDMDVIKLIKWQMFHENETRPSSRLDWTESFQVWHSGRVHRECSVRNTDACTMLRISLVIQNVELRWTVVWQF